MQQIKTPKISVIIPVYNAEPYLHECLDSVIRQTVKDIEIICVDDGSTDGSVQILNEYAAQDARITVIKQNNLHAGIARNAGIAIAKGEYLHFIDADDCLYCNDVYERLYRVAAEQNFCNIIRCKATAFDDATGNYIHNEWYERDNLPADLNNVFINPLRQIEIIGKLSVVPWMGIIRRSFVTENKLTFNASQCCNDRSFFITSCLKAKNIYLSDIYIIKHRINNTSSLVGTRDKYFDSHFKSINIIKDFCEKNHINDAVTRQIIVNELSDMMAWFKKYFLQSKYSYKIFRDTVKFLKKINISRYEPEILDSRNYKMLHKLATVKFPCRLTYWLNKETWKMITSGNRSVYYVFGLPVWAKYRAYNNITVKYHILGIPVWKISKKYE